MECRIIYLLLLFVARIVNGNNVSNSSSSQSTKLLYDNCPPWYFYNTTTEKCECFSHPSTNDIVQCTEKGALLSFGYCLTFDERYIF